MPNGGLKVVVRGVTKDLDGGLGGVSSSSGGSSGGCLIARLIAGKAVLERISLLRDLLLSAAPFRWIVSVYYALAS